MSRRSAVKSWERGRGAPKVGKKRTGVRKEVATWSSSSEINLGTGRVANGLNGLKGTRVGGQRGVDRKKTCNALSPAVKGTSKRPPSPRSRKGPGNGSGWGKEGMKGETWTSSKLSGFSGASKNIWPGPAIKGAIVEKYGYGALLQGLRARGSRDTPGSAPFFFPTRQVALHQPTSIRKEYETAPAHVAQVSSIPLDSADATYASRTSDIDMDEVRCLDGKSMHCGGLE